MFRPMRWLFIATAFAPTAAAAQLQVNQNFVTQGPSPSFGLTSTVQSGDAPPNGNVAGAIGPVVALDANTLFVGTPAGGIWKTTNGGTSWTPLTDKQASLSIASLSLDPTDPTGKTLIAGTGLTANGTVCSTGACFFTGSGGLRDGLLYSQDGGNTWTSLGAATLANQSVVGVAARGNVMVAGTFEISGLGGNKNTGALFRSTDGGQTFTQISGGADTGLPNGPVSSIVGDPNNPNRLYAAVTAPNVAGNASTAIFVSNDTGATWKQVFGAGQSGETIQGSTQHNNCDWPWRCHRRGSRQFGDEKGDRTFLVGQFGRDLEAASDAGPQQWQSGARQFCHRDRSEKYKLSLRIGR